MIKHAKYGIKNEVASIELTIPSVLKEGLKKIKYTANFKKLPAIKINPSRSRYLILSLNKLL